MKKVKITLKSSHRFPGIVYAEARLTEPYTLDNGEILETGTLITNATLDYVIDACDRRGIEIVNAQTILTQLHRAGNEFKYC